MCRYCQIFDHEHTYICMKSCSWYVLSSYFKRIKVLLCKNKGKTYIRMIWKIRAYEFNFQLSFRLYKFVVLLKINSFQLFFKGFAKILSNLLWSFRILRFTFMQSLSITNLALSNSLVLLRITTNLSI